MTGIFLSHRPVGARNIIFKKIQTLSSVLTQMAYISINFQLFQKLNGHLLSPTK